MMIRQRSPPSWVHMSRVQDEAASVRRRISQTSDNQHQATPREIAEVEVPHTRAHPCRSKTGSSQMKKTEGKRPKFMPFPELSEFRGSDCLDTETIPHVEEEEEWQSEVGREEFVDSEPDGAHHSGWLVQSQRGQL